MGEEAVRGERYSREKREALSLEKGDRNFLRDSPTIT